MSLEFNENWVTPKTSLLNLKAYLTKYDIVYDPQVHLTIVVPDLEMSLAGL